MSSFFFDCCGSFCLWEWLPLQFCKNRWSGMTVCYTASNSHLSLMVPIQLQFILFLICPGILYHMVTYLIIIFTMIVWDSFGSMVNIFETQMAPHNWIEVWHISQSFGASQKHIGVSFFSVCCLSGQEHHWGLSGQGRIISSHQLLQRQRMPRWNCVQHLHVIAFDCASSTWHDSLSDVGKNVFIPLYISRDQSPGLFVTEAVLQQLSPPQYVSLYCSISGISANSKT